MLTAWLCASWPFVEFAIGLLAKISGNCHDPRGLGNVECIVLGVDISKWVNGLKMGGFAFAFVGLPWLLIGAVLVAIVLLIRVSRASSQ